TDRNVNAVKWTVIFIALLFRGFVQARLTDDRVDRDRRFSGRAIANDKLALPTTNRNHRVDRHNPGLHRLADAAALDHARRDFFERIKCFGFDFALAIERLSYRIDHATEQSLSDGS